MLLYMIFLMAAGLAPNLPSHLVFRFFAGFFASTPLTCAGGTVADLWNPLEKTWAFPAYAVPAFVGPMTGQVIGSYIPSTIGWRWLEWIMLIFAALVLVLILLFQAETYADLILCWKASILRKETGDMRYRAPIEVDQESLAVRLKRSVSRPFQMFYHELIIVVVSLYLTIIYIILFTFLEGYVYIFGETYGLSRGLTSVCWSGMIVGNLLIALLVPYVYKKTVKSCKENNGFIAPEMRLWYTMLGGAPSVPVSLFWMGWTSRVSFPARRIISSLRSLTNDVVNHLHMVSFTGVGPLRFRYDEHLRGVIHVLDRLLRHLLSFGTGLPRLHALYRCRGRHCGWCSHLRVFRCSVHTVIPWGCQCHYGCGSLLAVQIRTHHPEAQQICRER